MRKLITVAVAAATLAGAIAASPNEAFARDHRDYRDHRGRGGEEAAAAIAGFALGAVVGGGARGYSGGSYYAPRYYDRGYGGYGDYGYAAPRYRQQCWTERFWDPYYGRVHRRVCR